MLSPQDRTVLLEALKPPEGFVFSEGIATTYSLDLVTLLTCPLAFTMFEWEDSQGQLTSNPVLLLEALRRHIDQLTIFCQAGRIAVPPRPNPLFGYLEPAIVEVTSPHPMGVFHPKVWVLRYTGDPEGEEAGATCYRLLCLSRNLTDDPSWDLSLCLEGRLMDRKNAFAVNHPLADFVKALPGLALREVPDSARERATRIAEELRRVDFLNALPDPFDGLDFHPLGIERYQKDPLRGEWSQSLVISPFIDATNARYFAENTTGSVLVSRQEELDRLPRGALDAWERVFVLAQGAEGEAEPGGGDAATSAEQPHGLHAKLFLRRQGHECRIYVGSANATEAAFERNVEFLVELIGKRGTVGVDRILEEGQEEASLRSLLTEYEPPPEPPDDQVERTLDDLLDGARRAMVDARWSFQAEAGTNEAWRLRLARAQQDALPLPKGTRLQVWPISLPQDAAAQPMEANARELVFPIGGPSQLTTFLACEVTATHEGTPRTARFVLNLPLLGAPAGRREGILRYILDDSTKVLRFLQFLLEDEGIDPMGDLDGSSNGTGQAAHGGAPPSVLLEALLRALTHDPARLDEVHSLLQDLGDGAEGERRIPQGLMQVWPAIWAAREGLRR